MQLLRVPAECDAGMLAWLRIISHVFFIVFFIFFVCVGDEFNSEDAMGDERNEVTAWTWRSCATMSALIHILAAYNNEILSTH